MLEVVKNTHVFERSSGRSQVKQMAEKERKVLSLSLSFSLTMQETPGGKGS